MSNNNLPVKNNLRPLPTLADLHKEPQQAFKNDEFKLLLNQPVSEKWIKINKMANNSQYLPIDKVEFLLDYIFQEWRVEVLREGIMFHSIYVTVRVHYLNPITGQWSFHDGVGAKSVQTDKDKSASDLAHIKDAAVQMALPTAKSIAIKDACDHLGKLFGRDLTRKDVVPYSSAYARPEETEPEAPPAETKKPEPQPEAPQPTPESEPQPTSDPNDLPLF